jgi:hypothetical protein
MLRKIQTILVIISLLTGIVFVDSKPAQSESIASIALRIRSGTTFTVTFDRVDGKFDDSPWGGTTDPMGTLKAGETYTVKYFDGKYTTTGLNEGSGKVITATYGNAKPEEGKISLWGRVYTFTEWGGVIDPEFGVVGTLRF